MLLRLLRSAFFNTPADQSELPVELPHERQLMLAAAHHGAPRDIHSRILFSEMRIGSNALVDFTNACARDSDSAVPPLKTLHRTLASYFLARYFLYSLGLAGARAECGVFTGMSALLICRAAQTGFPQYDGADLHLIDSFKGLSRPVREDHVSVRKNHASDIRSGTVYAEGALASSADAAKLSLREFPGVRIHPGWIPDVFETLPETPWSFVHIDVDLYEPTLASLEYFYPRLVHRGVIICDDYGAPLFPGSHRAWDEFCAHHNIPYVVLDTGQSVILK